MHEEERDLEAELKEEKDRFEQQKQEAYDEVTKGNEELRKRQEAAYEKIYKEYPRWKNQAIEEDCPKITKQLAEQVIELAESENINEW